MKRPGLGLQLGVAFAVVAGATALLITAVLAVSWQTTFENYVRERVQSNATDLADVAGTLYHLNNGWSDRTLVQVAVSAQRSGLRIQLLDKTGAVLVDSASIPLGSGMPGVDVAAIPVPSVVETGPMQEPVVIVPIYSVYTQVGSIRVASLSPGSLLTESDVAFRSASSQGLAVAAALAVILASAGGLMYSRLFTRPIERVTKTAAALRAGARDARTGMSGEDAVGQLGSTLDEMAASIEAERAFERRLTADVAHELRTPLQAIQATVEAMQDGVLPADGEHLGIVRDETVRMGRLADSILELSRLENRSVAFRMAPIDPSAPLLRAVESHRALFDSLDLGLETHIDDGGLVEGDMDRLTQAFGNLVSNAARYTPEGGRVSVGLALQPREAVITVSDTGIGIAEEEHDRVFTRFWRSDEARQRTRSGFGVGLAVVREIVEQHGGAVGFRANTPGPGTTFEIRLPLVRKRQKI